ncbi:MAG: hypothetical protein ACE5GN_03955 [Waddliaceae bacterium]
MEDLKIPNPILGTCDACQYYRRSNLNDKYKFLDWVSRGYCTFYKRDMFFDTKCWALHLIEKYRNLEIQDTARLAEAKERAIEEHERLLKQHGSEIGALGFNWGSFVLTPLWLLFHGRVGTGIFLILLNIVLRAAGFLVMEEALLVLFIFIQLSIQVIIMSYFGLVGNEIAWKNKGYVSVDELRKKQRGWNIVGILVGVFIILPILLINLYFLSQIPVDQIR